MRFAAPGRVAAAARESEGRRGAARRGLTVVAIVSTLGAAGLFGCAGGAPPPVGTSLGPRRSPRADAGAPQPPAAPLSFLPPEEAQTLELLGQEGAPSRHHFVGSAVLTAFANAAAAKAYREGGAYPEGSWFVVRHATRDGLRPLPTFAMHKGGAGAAWRYIVADARGNVTHQGPLELCAACHREAPRDSVFTLPP